MKLVLNVIKNYTNVGSFILLATPPRKVFEFSMFLFRYNVEIGFPLIGEILLKRFLYLYFFFFFSIKNVFGTL